MVVQIQDVQVLLVPVPAILHVIAHPHLLVAPVVLQAVQAAVLAHVVAVVQVLAEVGVPIHVVQVVLALALVLVAVGVVLAVLALAAVDAVQVVHLLAKVDVKEVALHHVPVNVVALHAVEFVLMSVIGVSVMEAVRVHAKTPVKALASILAI